METTTKTTSQQWWEIIKQKCLPLFLGKAKDYGTSWRIMRPISLTDQIFIKASRLRSIEDKRIQKVPDDIKGEYVGMINYCIMAIIQLHLPEDAPKDLPYDTLESLYLQEATCIHDLFMNKNHDYGEAWRDMRVSSLTDIILMKLLRIKQIEDNRGVTTASEGVEPGYMDILNYSIFALIKLGEE